MSLYTVNISAYKAKDCMQLSLFSTSLIYNLDRDKLSNTAGSYSGIYTPTAYVSLEYSLFASHLKDSKNLCAINYLHAEFEKFGALLLLRIRKNIKTLFVTSVIRVRMAAVNSFIMSQSLHTVTC